MGAPKGTFLEPSSEISWQPFRRPSCIPVLPVRHWKLALFILAVLALLILPNPEVFIIKAVERAGLLLILGRGD